jgi:hypothetical protein
MAWIILKTRYFQRWVKKAGLSDRALFHAVIEMTNGLIDADLGGGIIKKRIALPGHGKRGSTRTLLATNRNDRWIFVFGFEKNDRANVSAKELEALQLLAEDLLALNAEQIAEAVSGGQLLEVGNETRES